MNFWEFMKFYIDKSPADFIVFVIIIALVICSAFKWLSEAVQSFTNKK
jgi:VanZ family protein